jgi:hypothetical protein
VETRLDNIHWMSPVDLKYADLIADPEYAAKVLGGPHSDGGHYITTQGQVLKINDIGIPELLRRMVAPELADADGSASNTTGVHVRDVK